MAERQERADAARNRAAILRAAEDLLATHPPAEVSIDRVAATAGVGKGTVFRRFGDRDGLMRALAVQRAEALQEAFTSGPPPLGPGAPPAQRLAAFLDAALDLVTSNINLITAHERATAHRDGDSPVYLAWHGHIAALIAQARPDLDADVLAHVVLGAMSSELVVRMLRTGQTERLARSLHHVLISLLGQDS
jgi:AcrR family transcriptional regulator